MKTLIVCVSKHGATEMAAKKLMEKLDGSVDCVNLKKNQPESIDGYERVIFGTSIYAGKVHKELVSYVAENEEQLLNKKYAFFVCCGFEAKAEIYLRENFSDELIDNAIFVKYFGQETVLSRMKFMERTIFKAVSKSTEDINDIRDKEIDETAEILNGM